MNKINFRVYYEDTDAGGVMYHSNYLNFFERARSEYLREFNCEQSNLAKDNILFVVKNIFIDYIKSAKLDDLVTINTQIIEFSKTSMKFKQTMNLQEIKLSEAEVLVVCVNTAFKPIKIPMSLIDKLGKI